MKLFSLHDTPFEPISHDPQLKKKVLTRNTIPHIKHISHASFPPGSTVSEHSHSDGAEVFYCIRGKAAFFINGQRAVIMEGHLLIIEPGELHSISEIREETELLYFYTEYEK